jgi:hypothetical protein
VCVPHLDHRHGSAGLGAAERDGEVLLDKDELVEYRSMRPEQ